MHGLQKKIKKLRSVEADIGLFEFELFVFAAAVGDAVGGFGLDFFLVGGEVALEPLGFAAAFEDEQVGADAVEEAAVVADDHGAALEVDDGLFEDDYGAHHWPVRRGAGDSPSSV